jgi:hypothetical protein
MEIDAMQVPALEHHCGSWIAVSRATGLPVAELYSKRLADAVDQSRYELLTALQWLTRLNGQLSAS